MGDVFLSYKAEDRARIRPLVTALEADGLSVWWDARIEGGAAWRQSIEAQLQAARCVIVVWSKRSVGPEGEFVHDEASDARKRGVYLPVRIDEVEPPLGFRQTQALKLKGWKGDRADPAYQTLLGAVRSMVGGAEGTAPRPEDRARPALDRRVLLAGGGVLVAGAAGVGGWALWQKLGGGAKEDTASIAVLPFANLSRDPEQAYFADGLAEELRSALSRIGKLKVIGRTSSEAVRDDEAKVAAGKLGVANILTGSVRKSATLIRVSAQLVDGSNGVERWSETYDRPVGDALAIQSGIAQSVAQALALELAPEDRAALAAGGTKNAAAHDLFLKADAVSRDDDTAAGLKRALALIDAAIALDPNYAEAYAFRAERQGSLAGQYPESPEWMRSGIARAAADARRAIELAPRSAAGHAALALALQYQLDFAGSLKEHERAYQVGRGDARTLKVSAAFLGPMGRSDEALGLISQARSLDPLDAGLDGRQAEILFYARRYDEAAVFARRALERVPKRNAVRMTLADALLMTGRTADAQAEYAKVSPEYPLRPAREALIKARTGDRAGSDRAFADFKARYGEAGSYQWAEIYAQRGERGAAFEALETAMRAMDPGLVYLRTDPFLDSLKKDPRFAAIEKRLNFPPA